MCATECKCSFGTPKTRFVRDSTQYMQILQASASMNACRDARRCSKLQGQVLFCKSNHHIEPTECAKKRKNHACDDKIRRKRCKSSSDRIRRVGPAIPAAASSCCCLWIRSYCLCKKNSRCPEHARILSISWRGSLCTFWWHV